jgi:hypothetical protein
LVRLLADLRESQSTDAECEFTEVCYTCLVYPPAHNGQCFNCASAGRLPS